MRRAVAPRAHKSGQVELTGVGGGNKKPHRCIASAAVGRGERTLDLIMGRRTGVLGGPYSLSHLGSIPSRSTTEYSISG